MKTTQKEIKQLEEIAFRLHRLTIQMVGNWQRLQALRIQLEELTKKLK